MSSSQSSTARQGRNLEIAQTIAAQMGGMGRLKIMTGASKFVVVDDGLRFCIPGKNFAKDSINLIEIILTPRDDYTMTFYRVRGLTAKEVRRFEGVYCDMLVPVFTEATGLKLFLR